MATFKRLVESLVARCMSVSFKRRVREQHCRQEFLYNAFKALAFNGIDGDYAEFGCCGGMTFGLAFREAARHRHKAKLWAFDSFQGLPPSTDSRDPHPKWVGGTMKTELDEFHAICESKGIPRTAYEVVPGFYDESLSRLAPGDAPSRIALAYIDCDLYSSTKAVLDFLEPRLRHGMLLAFDDYYCWSATQSSGERLALLEFSARHPEWTLLPYMRFGWHGQSFVVEDNRGLTAKSNGR